MSAQQAAHLLDHILPYAPLRQWALTLPFELCYRCSYDPETCSAIRRIGLRSIFDWQKRVGKVIPP